MNIIGVSDTPAKDESSVIPCARKPASTSQKPLTTEPANFAPAKKAKKKEQIVVKSPEVSILYS